MADSTATRASSASSDGALAGVRILDLTRLLPGPFATQMLGDLGAEILKVEDPVRGDYARFAPPVVQEEGARFMALNRNKRSLKLNLKHEAGREVLRRLVPHVDVLIEQFRPGVMDRLGVGYESLRALNPALVYCALTGYGQDGPYRDRAGHDLNYLSLAGVTGLSGPADGLPSICGVQIADVAGGGLMAAIGVLAALRHRDRTGEGQLVDISMLDGSWSLLSMHAADHLATGRPQGRETEALNGAFVCYRVYETADGRHLSVAALEPQFWAAFCRAIERPDLEDDAFCQGERRAQVLAELTALFRSRSRDEWVARFAGFDACVEPVLDLGEASTFPQLEARGMTWTLDHPTEGPVRQPGCPIRLSRTPAAVRRMPPRWGEHTHEVLRELGLGEAEIDAFERDGAFT